LIGSVIGGLLIDRMNKSFLMSMFLLLTAIGTAVLPWCTKLYLLIVTIAFQGVAMGFVDTGEFSNLNIRLEHCLNEYNM
jgi:MFS family permease